MTSRIQFSMSMLNKPLTNECKRHVERNDRAMSAIANWVTDGTRTHSEQLHKLSPRPLASITMSENERRAGRFRHGPPYKSGVSRTLHQSYVAVIPHGLTLVANA
jgi:hypothetical protein